MIFLDIFSTFFFLTKDSLPFYFYFGCFEIVSLNKLGCLGTCLIDQIGLKLMEILPLNLSNAGMYHHPWLKIFFLLFNCFLILKVSKIERQALSMLSKLFTTPQLYSSGIFTVSKTMAVKWGIFTKLFVTVTYFRSCFSYHHLLLNQHILLPLSERWIFLSLFITVTFKRDCHERRRGALCDEFLLLFL